MKKHFTGATYDLTQENMNHLIAQLEESNKRIKSLFDRLRTKDSEVAAARMGRAAAAVKFTNLGRGVLVYKSIQK